MLPPFTPPPPLLTRNQLGQAITLGCQAPQPLAEGAPSMRSALDELERLLMRTRAVEASLAAAPLPRCSGSLAGQCPAAAPPPQPDAHCAPAPQPCRPQCPVHTPAASACARQAPPDGPLVPHAL